MVAGRLDTAPVLESQALGPPAVHEIKKPLSYLLLWCSVKSRISGWVHAR